MQISTRGQDYPNTVLLTPDETDRFFERYDPTDKDMPSYLHNVGHRYVKEFIYNWLIENFGSPDDHVWSFGKYYDAAKGKTARTITFENPDHAMLFMTIWAGKPLDTTT